MFKKTASKKMLQAVFLIAVIFIPTVADAAGIAWKQPLERVWIATTPRVSAISWWVDSMCDGDPTDSDYVYMFAFNTAVTNPDGVRAFSKDVKVDAMLLVYQQLYGGINGWGNTSSPYVYVCLGDTVNTLGGGPGNVYNYLKLLQ